MHDPARGAPSPSPTSAGRLGLPAGLGWGIAAIAIFIVGDALEIVWISAFFAKDIGISLSQAAWIVTAFGAVFMVASFLVGPLCSAMHPRRVMLFGLIAWCLIDAVFIAFALPSRDFWFILITYALRGIGSPFFCFTYLVWLTERVRDGKVAWAHGWFHVSISGGQQILGVLLAGFLLDRIGPIPTLWVGLAIAAAGGTMALLLLHDPEGTPPRMQGQTLTAGMLQGTSILWREPRIAAGGIVKMINTGGILGLYVFYVPYLTETVGVPTGQAVLVFTILGITGVPGNLFWGWASERIGWANTVQWFACPINAVAIALLYFVPLWFGPNFALIAAVMLFWGIGTSAFGPLSALMPRITPNEVGNAISIVNFATGLALVTGPGLVGLLLPFLGYFGLSMTLAALYVLAFVLMFHVQLPGRARTSRDVPV